MVISNSKKSVASNLSGFVMVLSITVPGRGLFNRLESALKNLDKILLLTMITVRLILKYLKKYFSTWRSLITTFAFKQDFFNLLLIRSILLDSVLYLSNLMIFHMINLPITNTISINKYRWRQVTSIMLLVVLQCGCMIRV